MKDIALGAWIGLVLVMIIMPPVTIALWCWTLGWTIAAIVVEVKKHVTSL